MKPRFNIFKARRVPNRNSHLDVDLGMKFVARGLPVEWAGPVPTANDFIIEVVDDSTWPVLVRETTISDPKELYFYKCFVQKIYDGDTATKVVVVLGSLGAQFTRMWSVRFSDVDTPEMNEPGGVAMRDLTRRLLLGQWAMLATKKDKTGKYGRLIGRFFIGELNVNEVIKLSMERMNEYNKA